MKTESLTEEEQELIELIGTIPLEPVPADLKFRVMQRVSRRRLSVVSALRELFLRPHRFEMRPVYGLALVVLVLVSFTAGKHWQLQTVSNSGEQVAEPSPVPAHIDNPYVSYSMGRALLLTGGKEDEALSFLKRAALLEPDNPEFAYWEGVACWSNGRSGDERDSYYRGLKVDPENLSLLINLGHSYLGDGHYHDALEVYRSVLRVSPVHPVATYNSGLIYRKLGLTDEEIRSWKSYLAESRMGEQAFRAVDRLNAYGDYTFRTYRVGPRRVIIDHQVLIDDSLPGWKRNQEIAAIAAIMEKNPRLSLEIVVFDDGDTKKARAKARELKHEMIQAGGAGVEPRVHISWFGQPEMVQNDNSDDVTEISEAILMFSRLKAINREVKTI